MKNKQKQNKKIHDVNPVVAGMTGAAIGLGIVAAAGAAVVLNDKKSRGKAQKALINAKNQVLGYMDDMQKLAQDKKSEVAEEIDQGAKIPKKEVSLAEVSIH